MQTQHLPSLPTASSLFPSKIPNTAHQSSPTTNQNTTSYPPYFPSPPSPPLILLTPRKLPSSSILPSCLIHPPLAFLSTCTEDLLTYAGSDSTASIRDPRSHLLLLIYPLSLLFLSLSLSFLGHTSRLFSALSGYPCTQNPPTYRRTNPSPFVRRRSKRMLLAAVRRRRPSALTGVLLPRSVSLWGGFSVHNR